MSSNGEGTSVDPPRYWEDSANRRLPAPLVQEQGAHNDHAEPTQQLGISRQSSQVPGKIGVIEATKNAHVTAHLNNCPINIGVGTSQKNPEKTSENRKGEDEAYENIKQSIEAQKQKPPEEKTLTSVTVKTSLGEILVTENEKVDRFQMTTETDSGGGIGNEDCGEFYGPYFKNRHPLKPGINVYGGYQNFVPNEKLLLAIKTIRPYEPKNNAEVKLLLALKYHPNIVQIVAAFKLEVPSHELWIVMERCSLDTLKDYVTKNLSRKLALNIPRTTDYTKHLVEGMKFIHKKGIIHRDLKPDNILFSIDGKFLKIADFGLSKRLEHGCSTAESSRDAGTDGYRAPETYLNNNIKKHSDIFSLGLVIHVLWTNGDHPYGPNSDLWVHFIKTDKTQAYCDLSKLPKECPKRDDLLELLTMMLQFNHRNRPSIKEIASSSFFSANPQLEQRQLGRVQNCRNRETVPKEQFLAPTPAVGGVFTDRAPMMPASIPILTVPPPIRSVKQNPAEASSLGSATSASTMLPADVNTQNGQGIPDDVSQEDQQQEDIRSLESYASVEPPRYWEDSANRRLPAPLVQEQGAHNDHAEPTQRLGISRQPSQVPGQNRSSTAVKGPLTLQELHILENGYIDRSQLILQYENSGIREEDYVGIKDSYYVKREPMKKGTKLYRGYQKFGINERLPVAVKVIFPYNEKNESEVKNLLTLRNHSNIVQILAGVYRSFPRREVSIVMELCSMETLQDYIKRKRGQTLDINQTMEYNRHLVAGLEHIHDRGIVHRDLKPDNILFSRDSSLLKIADFGLSKQLQFGRSTAKTSRWNEGTDGYRAPETYLRNEIKRHSDIFSQGLVIHVLWTGDHAYGPNSDLWVHFIKTDKNQNNCDFSKLPDFPKRDDLHQLLTRMLQFDPSNRPCIKEVVQSSFFSTDPRLEQRQCGTQNCRNRETVPKEQFLPPIQAVGEFVIDRPPTMPASRPELTVPPAIRSVKQNSAKASNSGTVENSPGSAAAVEKPGSDSETKQNVPFDSSGDEVESTSDDEVQASEVEPEHQCDISPETSSNEEEINMPNENAPSALGEELEQMKQRAETQLTTPVTKVEESGNITLNGCACRLPKQTAETSSNVLFTVKMNSSDVPLGYTGISPEVTCKTSKRISGDIIITVPIHTIPNNSTKIQIAWKKSENFKWDVLDVKPTVKAKTATFSTSRSGIFRAIVNSLQGWSSSISHHIFFNPKKFVFCDMTCTSDETTKKKCTKSLEGLGFCTILWTKPEKMTLRKNDEMTCEYGYYDTTSRKVIPFHSVTLRGSMFFSMPYFHDFFKPPISREMADTPFQYILTLGEKTHQVQFALLAAMDINPELAGSEPAAEPPPPPTPVYRVGDRLPLIEVTPSTQEFYGRCRNNRDVYPVGQYLDKGKVLIINNKFRGQEDERFGSEVDVGNLEALWRSLGFDVQVENNLTANEMRQHYTEFATNAKDVSIVVLIIMSHGGKRGGAEFFFAEDRNEVSSEDVIFAFSPTKSPHLKGIPKVFIFQACRGDDTDAGLENSNIDMDNRGRKYPERSDMLIVYPSQSGFVSFRNRETGSWMMNAVTDVFMRNAHDTHVLDMLTKVNGKIAEMQTVEGYVQTCNQFTYLTKDLYLLPGWPRKLYRPTAYRKGYKAINTHV